MMSLGMLSLWLLLMLLFLLINAFFVAIEFALIALRKSRVQELIDNKHPVAPLVQRLQNKLDQSVSGAQLGITLASLALGWIGEHSIHELVVLAMNQVPFLSGLNPPAGIGVVISFTILSLLHVIVGEQLPKIAALRLSEDVALRLAPLFNVYCQITRPFIWVMDRCTTLLLKPFNIDASDPHHNVHTPEELEILIEESRDAGELGERETDLLKRVLDLKDLSVSKVMVPKTRMDAIPVDLHLEELLAVVARTKHSKLPVYENADDNIIGILNTRDLFDLWNRAAHSKIYEYARITRDFNIRSLMRPAIKVAQTAKASVLLDDLRARKSQMAIVVNEQGKAVGHVTMEDLLEQLVGEIYDEYDSPTKPGARR